MERFRWKLALRFTRWADRLTLRDTRVLPEGIWDASCYLRDAEIALATELDRGDEGK